VHRFDHDRVPLRCVSVQAAAAGAPLGKIDSQNLLACGLL
jgi:hypothetical protein